MVCEARPKQAVLTTSRLGIRIYWLGRPRLGVLPSSFIGSSVAQLSHVATDHFHNHLSRWGYFIVYRLLVRFDAAEIAGEVDIGTRYKDWPRLLPFGQYLKPWFHTKIDKRIESRDQSIPWM